MDGKFVPEVFSYAGIDKENIPLYGEGGAITRYDNAYFRSQTGNLVIISLAFGVTDQIASDSPIMYFNSYTGQPNSNVYGTFVNQNGTCTSVYLGNSNGTWQVYNSAVMAAGMWRGFILFTVNV